jgi:hypothetical protein
MHSCGCDPPPNTHRAHLGSLSPFRVGCPPARSLPAACMDADPPYSPSPMLARAWSVVE